MQDIHHISAERFTLADVVDIIKNGKHLDLSESARERIVACRQYLDNKIKESDTPVYGITTGFGSLCNISIDPDQLAALQANLVMSHSCGTGDPVPAEIIRLMMLFKIQSLSYGNSGVQLDTVERLIYFFNHDLLPVVFQQGSLGASGDLAPLAMMSLPLIGLGEVYDKGVRRPAADVLAEHGLKPLTLQSKEGLALLNGTQFMSAYGVWALIKTMRLLDISFPIAAMSLDAFDGRIEPFCAPVNQVRHHAGQAQAAALMCRWLDGSEIISQPKKHVQDPYSFRCIPQVVGAVIDTFNHVRKVLEDEINSPTDNPTIFPELDLIVSAGNFHGEPIALPMDFLAVALSELANISERRIYKLISGQRGLPSFLVANPGLNSGFMIPQYTAASIVSQNKGLCWPASCDSIPSSQGQEDHVSMGSNAATKLYRVALNTERVLAIELFNAAQALDFRRPLKSSQQIEDLHALYRKDVPFIDNDTVMYPLIERSIQFIRRVTD